MLNVTDLGEGPAILWIHAFPLSSAIFEPQLAIKRMRHVMPDLPGFGESPAPSGPMTVDDYARIAIDVLDHRGLDRAVFAGVSMGGYICLAAARLAPERFAGLMLIDTRETADDEKTRAGRLETIEKVKQQGITPLIESMLPKMLTPAAPPELRDQVRGIMASATPAGVISALEALAARPDSTETLRNISVPILIVVGENDTITPPADAQRMAALHPSARLVQIANAAHLSNLEQPEEFNRAASLFVANL